jgi:hypothetical protein
MVRRKVIGAVHPRDGGSLTVYLGCGHRMVIQPRPNVTPETAACDACTDRRHHEDRRKAERRKR